MLPGHGSKYADCGDLRSFGCLNVEGHGVTLEADRRGKVFVKRFYRSCGRLECPICYEKACARAAHRATRRIERYKHGRPIHVVASPSQALVDSLTFDRLKKVVRGALQAAGVRGGLLIVHPWRERRKRGSWYLSPHFHTVCYGWIKNSEAVLRKTGVLVKNLGIRKSVYATIMYQLSHAGVYMAKPKKATVTWYGELSYNKLNIEKEVPEKSTCPLCGSELVKLAYRGEKDPPSKECEFWDLAENWGR